MKRWIGPAVLTLCAATAADAATRRELTESFALDDAAVVIFDMAVGEAEIEVWDSDRVEVSLDVRCRSRSSTCERRMELVEVVDERRGERLEVKVEGISKTMSGRLEVDARVRLPRRVELVVDMGIGELDVSGVERDVFVDMGIGEVRLWVAERAVRSVFLDAGIGESALYGAEAETASRPFLVGSELGWEEGAGSAEIVVDLGIGEVSVHLE